MPNENPKSQPHGAWTAKGAPDFSTNPIAVPSQSCCPPETGSLPPGAMAVMFPYLEWRWVQ